MPTTDGYGQGVPYPVMSDAPNIELAFQGAVNALTALSVLRFANANERSAKLVGPYKPVPGMVTYLIAEDRWEGYQADGKWMLMSDGPWTPLSFAAGYSAQGGSPGWRRKAGGGIELRGRVRRTNGGPLVNTGEIITFATIPAAATPGATRYFITSTNRTTTGSVTHYTCRVEVSFSGQMRYTVEAGGGEGTTQDPPWFSLDGVTFSPAGD
ncbi:hypothetical protein [Streptomyces californicus]|uniref:hypothetical protein n=1 Tax=Streptomyces californicus TaxID=67351 RepID=UPI00067B06F4|nr:hypothetical protein [Streptomyces californicus]QRV53502.1 hypothetical protein I6J40_04280 [Streptomyces californicus]